MTNSLQIQKYEDEIAALNAKLDRLIAQDHAEHQRSFYLCLRCGCLYQSPWGCGCPKAQENP